MKVRSGFVSNSSSSSFVICIKSVDDFIQGNEKEVIETVLETMFDEDIKFGTSIDLEQDPEDIEVNHKSELLDVARKILNMGNEFAPYHSDPDATLGYRLLNLNNNQVLISSTEVSSDSGSATYILKDDLINKVSVL